MHNYLFEVERLIRNYRDHINELDKMLAPHLSKISCEARQFIVEFMDVLALKADVTEQILKNSPSFFERLVVDLLLKMGYGYDNDSGFVTGQSHDGGIDGIIFQDKLGLDRIYIQAKRYALDNKVGRATLQAFIGAMEDVQKGVFITTSQFTNEAISYANKQQQKQIKLIDGTLLSELLIKHEVGISAVQVFKIYRIDTDYYGV